MPTQPWQTLIEQPPPRAHVGVVYREVAFLARVVAAWSAPSLRAGGGAILLGTPTHTEAIRGALKRSEVDVVAAEREGRLLVVDADWLMAHFVLDGSPMGAAFERLVGDIVGRVRQAARGAPVRAWGEMVCLLRSRGNAEAARRVEALWEAVIESQGISLLCSYEAGADASEPSGGLLEDVLASHTHVVRESAPGPGLMARDIGKEIFSVY